MKNTGNKKIQNMLLSIFIAMVTVGICLQMFSLSYPSIMKEFAIGKIETGILGSCLLSGMGVGGLASGFLADGFGRLRVVRTSLALLPLVNLLVFFSESYLSLCICCFLSGMFVISIYYMGTLFVSENVESTKRATTLGLMQSGWSMGYIVSSLLFSLAMRFGWRSLFLIPMASSLLSLATMRDLSESGSSGGHKGPSGSRLGHIRALIKDSETGRIFVMWSITLFVLQFGYYGFSTWLPLYLMEEMAVDSGKSGIFIAGIYSTMFFGKIMTGYLADKVGRKKIWVFAGLATAFLLPLVVTVAARYNTVTFMPLFGLFYGAPYAILSTYLSESFPARIRGLAVASTNTVGKVGAALSPLVVGMISDRFSISAGLTFLGAAYLAAAVIPGIFIDEKMYDPGRISKI